MSGCAASCAAAPRYWSIVISHWRAARRRRRGRGLSLVFSAFPVVHLMPPMDFNRKEHKELKEGWHPAGFPFQCGSDACLCVARRQGAFDQ